MNAERLLAYYERIADAPDTIVRLRRFILNLAVRGTLVPQDPNDEPASELLKRISLERNELVKTKIIRREEPLHPIPPAEVPFDAPAGWIWSRIGEAVLFTQYGTSQRSYPSNKGVPVLTMGNVQDGLVVWDNEKRIPETSEELPALYLRKFDLLYNRTNSAELVRKTGIYLGEDNVRTFASYLIRLRPSLVSSNPQFLNMAMNTTEFRETQILPLIKKQTGHANVNGTALKNMLVPLPPLADQHRIVTKVDELMALCDRLETARAEREKTRDRLSAASLARLNAPDPDPATFATHARFVLDNLAALTIRPDQIKQLRQTILNLAVRGQLVRQDPKDEPAEELLRRAVIAQRKSAEEEGLRSRPSIERVGRDDLWFEFPDSWALASFDDVFVIVSGVTKGQKIAQSESIEVPYLRVANVQRGHLDLAVIKKIAIKTSDKVRYRLRSGDILMTEGGDWDKLGRAAIWRDEIDGCIHQNHVFRVRPASKDILPEWVITYANSLLGRAFFEDASKQTTNLASINLTQLRACPLPLPPLAEQHRIVAKVNKLMTLCDRLEASLSTGSTTRRRLLDALLAEALEPAVRREAEAAAAE